MRIGISLCAVVLLFIHCQNTWIFEDEPTPEFSTPLYQNVHESLIPYFKSFEVEGRSRGYDIELSTADLIGVFENITENRVAGQCNYASHRPNQITIDIDFWNRSNTLGKEMIVFHELGHCYLNRDHLESAFSNGICRSIMRSGNGGCYDAYTEQNRSYYLDELFAGPRDWIENW